MQIDACGLIPSEISCQNPVQCYILMYITTARPSSLSLFSLPSFFLVIFPNLYNCNHIPASGKTLRCKLTLRYESMLFAHWRSGQKERLLSVCSTKFKTVKKSIWRNRTYKRKTGLMKHSPQTGKKAELLLCSLHERKEGKGRRGKKARRKKRPKWEAEYKGRGEGKSQDSHRVETP